MAVTRPFSLDLTHTTYNKPSHLNTCLRKLIISVSEYKIFTIHTILRTAFQGSPTEPTTIERIFGFAHVAKIRHAVRSISAARNPGTGEACHNHDQEQAFPFSPNSEFDYGP